MKPPLNTGTTAPHSKTHTIRLHFDETPEDQALYAALRACSEHECRTPLPRQVKYLLGMAMGSIQADLFLLKRLGLSSVDSYEFAANAAAAYVPPSPTRPPTTLRLIQGGPDGQSER